MKPNDNQWAAGQPPLSQSFYARRPEIVAPALLGKPLLHRTAEGIVGGWIAETEAYLASGDPACHAARRCTRRNRSMWGPAGHLYVYTIHTRFCVNVVTQRQGVASAVLIRAIEPVWGIPWMQQRRAAKDHLGLCRGPGMLCQSLGIDLNHDGLSVLTTDSIWIGRHGRRDKRSAVAAVPRIGISRAVELPLRFFRRGDPWVSGPKHWHRYPNADADTDADARDADAGDADVSGCV